MIQAIAKDANGTQKVKNISVTSIRIKNTADIEDTIRSEYGLSVNRDLTVPGTGAKYQIYSRDPDSTQWKLVRSYSTNPNLILRPRALGTTAYMVYTDYDNTVSTSYFAIDAYIPDKAYKEVELLNIQRKNNGLSELKLDPDLQFVANVRAEELDTLYDHKCPNGTSCFTVIEQYNIRTPAASGENIAWGYKEVESVVDAWMKSPKHRENFLNPNYTKIGVGNYLKYWSQMFTS